MIKAPAPPAHVLRAALRAVLGRDFKRNRHARLLTPLVFLRRPTQLGEIVLFRSGLAALSLCFLASGCGPVEISIGESDDESERDRSASSSAYTPDEEDVERPEERISQTCRHMTSEAVDLAIEMDGQLATAGSYEDYHQLVRELNVAYNRIDQNSADLACYDVIIPLAGAVDQYTLADDAWRQCNDDYYCDSADAEASAQKHWTKAWRQLEKARAALSE